MKYKKNYPRVSALIPFLLIFAFSGCPSKDKKATNSYDTQEPLSCKIDISTCPANNSCNPVDNRCYENSKFPNTFLTLFPASVVQETHTVFEFKSSVPESVFRCKLDSEEFHECVSPVSIDVMEGKHVFQVSSRNVSISPSALEDPTPSIVTWSVDTTAPLITILSPEDGVTTGSSGEVLFNSDDLNTIFQCTLDKQTVPCDLNQGLMFFTLSHGPHEVVITGVDVYGNQSSATRQWNVDGVGPKILIDTPTSKQVLPESGGVNFSFHAEIEEDSAVYFCRVDNSPFKVCTSPTEYSLSVGSHQIAVKGIDAYGNLGAEAVVSFSVK